MNSMLVLLQVLLKNFSKDLRSILSSVLKISISRIFVLFLVLIGTLFIFLPAQKEAKKSKELSYATSNKAAPSKINNYKGVNYFTDRINNRYMKDIRAIVPDDYIVLSMLGKTKKLNKSLIPKSAKKLPDPPKYVGTDGKCCPQYVVGQPVITGYACPPLVYTRPFTFFFPPPVVVVARTTAAAPPPEVPIPEPSSIIFGLTGLSGIFGFRKKILLK